MNVLVLGAGQLARMMALAGKPLNINVRAYDVGSEQVVDPLNLVVTYGSLEDGIDFSDVITAEFEHIDHNVLAICEASGKLKPSSQAIKTGGDRRLEKTLLEANDVPNAKHHIISTKADFDAALQNLSMPIIFKSALEGYDGKGQWRLKDASQSDAVWEDISGFLASAKPDKPQAIVAEQMVPFDREISMVGARKADGTTAAYPLTENHHCQGVLSVSLALECEQALQDQATEIFDKIANGLNYVGVLAIEFFQVGEKLLVNEIAPRVHNSGHWTQQGADVCQFENHLRAVCDLPLGSTALVRPTAMINILGTDTVPTSILALPSVGLHWYGKSQRPGRKMGHINISGANNTLLFERLTSLAEQLSETDFPEVLEYITNRSR